MRSREAELDSTTVLRPDVPGVVFTTRIGGDSRGVFAALNLSGHVGDEIATVESNRVRLSAALGISERWVTLRQKHGADVLEVQDASDFGEADAAVTSVPGLPLAVMAADCVTIALINRDRVGAVHAGWRGLLRGVIESAVEAIEQRPYALLGPCIGVCHYEVGPDVVSAFAKTRPDIPAFWEARDGKTFLDLRSTARWLLERSGAEVLDPEDPECTFCDKRFYSYRREGKTGRHALVIWRPE